MTTHQNPSDLTFRPFTISVPQDAIDDLHARLANARYAAEPADSAGTDDWSAGTPVWYLREMVEHWKDGFDWRAQEERMNAYPQLLTEIDGQTIHVVHVRSANEDATPLLLLHTYPGSFVDFLDVIPYLTDDFHLVIPSIPGVGFSQPLTDGAWDSRRNALAWDRLMRGLGYESYGAHGSDNGAIVARELAMLAPEGFLGAHVLQLFSFPSGDPAEFEKMTQADYAALEFAGWFQTVNGYATMNASRPRTIAGRTERLARRPAGLQRALRELRQRHRASDPRPGAHPGQPLLAHQQQRRCGAGLPRRAGGRATGQPRPDRRRGLRRRLPHHAALRGARQHRHRVVDRARRGWPLRLDGGPRGARWGDPRLLPLIRGGGAASLPRQ
ncbi:hypothetical protein J2X46_004784 [Nocardioides sp. BE266]|uniref:epoxide hydrolase family protein n=1 Tax=Nocardioides sp. BE266 TaxID=2817725 RepID=UPI00285D43E9|nr:epoxide hydrolase [Nocardioides sp. BE266]MDR7255767.1 hypothetical protein [Nocardioides sp. BE266]